MKSVIVEKAIEAMAKELLEKFDWVLETAEISEKEFRVEMEKIATQEDQSHSYGYRGKLWFLAGGLRESVISNTLSVLGVSMRESESGVKKLIPIILARAMELNKDFDVFVRSIIQGAEAINPSTGRGWLIREIDCYLSGE